MEVPDELPVKSRTLATYHGSEAEWHRLADALDTTGTRRVANAIRAGVRRRRHAYFGYVPLRFADGSIGVIDAALSEMRRQDETPTAPTGPAAGDGGNTA